MTFILADEFTYSAAATADLFTQTNTAFSGLPSWTGEQKSCRNLPGTA